MRNSEGSIYCWTVHFNVRSWRAFKNRRDARTFCHQVNGTIFKMVRSH